MSSCGELFYDCLVKATNYESSTVSKQLLMDGKPVSNMFISNTATGRICYVLDHGKRTVTTGQAITYLLDNEYKTIDEIRFCNVFTHGLFADKLKSHLDEALDRYAIGLDSLIHVLGKPINFMSVEDDEVNLIFMEGSEETISVEDILGLLDSLETDRTYHVCQMKINGSEITSHDFIHPVNLSIVESEKEKNPK